MTARINMTALAQSWATDDREPQAKRSRGDPPLGTHDGLITQSLKTKPGPSPSRKHRGRVIARVHTSMILADIGRCGHLVGSCIDRLQSGFTGPHGQAVLSSYHGALIRVLDLQVNPRSTSASPIIDAWT